MARISSFYIRRFAAPPSASKVAAVARLQNAIRLALGERYQTFLQGSYKNDTALADINDVDIVARRMRATSPADPNEWTAYFVEVAQQLTEARFIKGEVSFGDKCVKLGGGKLNADIVPAVSIERYRSDPLAVWSWREQAERPNYPRRHYANGIKKNNATAGRYKPLVRMFKRWASQYDDESPFAPSFYVECLVHSVPTRAFAPTYLPGTFYSVGAEICNRALTFWVPSVANDKNILVASEWGTASFRAFRQHLADDLGHVEAAFGARQAQEANEHWRVAFGDL
jgi:hypothetical protein